MFNVTARPPPLVSLAVVVPGPASSNGNRNCKVCACAVVNHGAEHRQITEASAIIEVFHGAWLFLLEEDNIGGVGCFIVADTVAVSDKWLS